MKMFFCNFKLALYPILVFGVATSMDYCNFPECMTQHVACQSSRIYSSKCPDNVQMVNVSQHKDRILTSLNNLRNFIASGRFEFLPVAGRMAEMKWNNELAYLAGVNVRTCQNQPDKCRATKYFPHPGQIIESKSYSGPMSFYTDEEILVEFMENWAKQGAYADADIIESYRDSVIFSKFASIINERNSDIGCAAVRFYADFLHHFNLVCNLSVQNDDGEAIYGDGITPAEDCGTKYGNSIAYPNLCHIKETYNYY